MVQGGSFNDSDGNHVGIDLNGTFSGGATPVTVSPRLNNGSVWYSWIDYNGSNLEVRLAETNVRPDAALLSYAIDLGTTLTGTGTTPITEAYIGFTSGIWAAQGQHDILTWEFRDNYDPINPVPEPATCLLFSLGLGGLAFFRRKFKNRSNLSL